MTIDNIVPDENKREENSNSKDLIIGEYLPPTEQYVLRLILNIDGLNHQIQDIQKFVSQQQDQINILNKELKMARDEIKRLENSTKSDSSKNREKV